VGGSTRTNRELPFFGSARETTDVADSPQTSVLLPTTRWNDACGEVTDQLREGDELLVIHDDDGDPVAGRTDTPEGVRFVAAGDPDRCSGERVSENSSHTFSVTTPTNGKYRSGSDQRDVSLIRIPSELPCKI
jgi:hypothetical protein